MKYKNKIRVITTKAEKQEELKNAGDKNIQRDSVSALTCGIR
jgi:hypothetical protein